MRKALLNELVVELDLEVLGPLLVKGREKPKGERTKDEAAMEFMRIRALGDTPKPYIPGGSIKGVLRSHAERIARASAPAFGCCNPFVGVTEAPRIGEWEASCSAKFAERDRLGERITATGAYRDACPICRLFGCTRVASRLLIDDAYVKDDRWVPEKRDGVAIDRFTGGASAGAKYDMRVIVKGGFATNLYLRNFERWQAGLLVHVMQDLENARLRFGSGKRRGLGRVRGVVRSIGLTYFGVLPQGCDEANPIVAGVGSLADPSWLEQWSEYGFYEDAGLPVRPIVGALRKSLSMPVDLAQPVWLEAKRCWSQFIAGYSLPDEMKQEGFQRREAQASV